MDTDQGFSEPEVVETQDIDGDGTPDVLGLDVDGDGIIDALAEIDEWGEITAVALDVDADGVIDSVTQWQEDGSVLVQQEVGDDGSTITLAYDPTGALFGAVLVDPMGGVTEMSGTGLEAFLVELSVFAPEGEPLTEPDSVVVSQVPIDETDCYCVEDVTQSDDYQRWVDERNVIQMDPTQIESVEGQTFIGEESDADFWFEQSTGYTCGPATLTQIISDFTGVTDDNETAVATWAAEHGLLTENGMDAAGMVTALNEFGVPATLEHDQTWDDLAGYLAEGRAVAMTVDTSEYWPEEEGRPEGAIDHVVRIVGIDTERGVAIISDTGRDDGHQMEVPLEAMDEAWSSPNNGLVDEQGQLLENVLIVSDAPDPTVDGTEQEGIVEPVAAGVSDASASAGLASGSDEIIPSDGGGFFSNPAGWVLVPVTLAASRIFAAIRG